LSEKNFLREKEKYIMSYDALLEYIDLFREKAEQGKLVIFVGAGVSQNVKAHPDGVLCKAV
jgi:hypothetical protein